MGFDGDYECWFCYVSRNCHELGEFRSEYAHICADCAEEHADEHAGFLERAAKVYWGRVECFICKNKRRCVYEVHTCFTEK